MQALDLLKLDGRAARRRRLDERPELLTPKAVQELLAQVNRELRVDLDRAAEIADTALWLAGEVGDPASLAFGHRAVANVRLFRRDYVGALTGYESALDGFARAGEPLEEAITRSAAVVALSHLGHYDRALEFACAARELFERRGDRLRIARLENNVGHMMTRRDRFSEALPRYFAALEIFEAEGVPSDVGITLRNIAVCHQELNDFDAAFSAYERARGYCRENDLPLVALEVEYNAAYLHYLRGEYARANLLFEEARKSSLAMDDREHAALCDLDQAEIFLELNLVEEAERLAARAVEGFEALGMTYEAGKALVYHGLALFRRHQEKEALERLGRARQRFERHGNRVWAAVTDLHRALVLFEVRWNAEAGELARAAYETFLSEQLPTKTALCEILLARLELAEGRAEAARRTIATALERIAPLGSPALASKAHYVAGLAEEALGHRERALERWRQAHETLEELRGHLHSEETKIAFLSDKRAIYEGLVSLTLRDLPTEASRRSAFTWAERAKSRSLADLMSSGGSLPPEPDAGPAAELRSELHWIYRQIDLEELSDGDRSLDRIDRLRDEARDRELELLRHRRQAEGDRPERRDAGTGVVGLEEVREVLPPDAVLIEYYIARGRLWAFVVSDRFLETVPLGDVEAVRELFGKLQLQLSKFTLGEEYARTFGDLLNRATRSFLDGLYRRLIEPLKPRLEARHLVIVPHDFLHHVPFQALWDGEGYLGDRYSLSYAPSSTVLHLCSTREVAPTSEALVLGVADAKAPEIEREAETVAEILPGARLILGEEATQERLTELGGGCRRLHIATHGLYRQDNPMFSAIQLGGGRMSLYDLYRLRLNAELAVLSGCATGLTAVRGADELVGLSRGLLYAGAQSVLVTLWDVHDESTARFMSAFYRHLIDGLPAASAGQRAAAEIRETHPHPYYWAPFVLIGKPATEATGGQAAPPAD